jgi:hypothetical protein
MPFLARMSGEELAIAVFYCATPSFMSRAPCIGALGIAWVSLSTASPLFSCIVWVRVASNLLLPALFFNICMIVLQLLEARALKTSAIDHKSLGDMPVLAWLARNVSL